MQSAKRWREDDADSNSFGDESAPSSPGDHDILETALQPLYGHDPISVLPADILLSIFSFIPTRPRVLVLALVCRLWRTAALSSITSLPCTANPQRALALLPCLQRYTPISDTRLIVIPPSLTDLTIAACNPCVCSAFVHPAPPTITLLRLDMQGPLCQCVLHLLRTNESTLTDLSLALQCETWSADMYEAVASVPLTNLTRLSLRLIELDPTALRFVPFLLAAVGGQLRYLSLSHHCARDHEYLHALFTQLANCNYPQLTSLRLELGSLPCLAVTTSFLAHAPHLRALELRVTLRDPYVPQLLSRCINILSGLALVDCDASVSPNYYTQLHAILVQCPVLAGVTLHGPAPESLWSPMAHRITYMTHVPISSPFLRCLIRLTHFEYASPNEVCEFPYLSALRYFAFDITKYPYARAITDLHGVLSYCRRLLTLRISLPHITLQRLASLRGLLRRAEKAGVELVEMGSPLARVQDLRHEFVWLAIEKKPVQEYSQEEIAQADEATDKADTDAQQFIDQSEEGGLSIGRPWS